MTETIEVATLRRFVNRSAPPETLELVLIQGWEFVRSQDGSTYFERCDACGGTGTRRGFEHVDGARCWPCSGAGYKRQMGDLDAVTRWIAERVRAEALAAKRAARREVGRQRAEEAERVRRTAWHADHAVMVELAEQLLDERDARHTELYDLAWKLSRGEGPMMPPEELARFGELVDARNARFGR